MAWILERTKIPGIEDRIGHTFKDKSLLETALTHRSFSRNNNERLEYLGDAILGFLVAEVLYNKYPDETEGVLTRLRSSFVKRDTLAELARKLQLGDELRLGTGEKKSGGWRRGSILANTVEAILGAIYLDSGIDSCRNFVLELYRELLDEISAETLEKDPKTELQEFLQARKKSLPVYNVISETGEAHSREFTVSCHVDDLTAPVTANGRSKRIAEQDAARKTLTLLQEA